MTSHDDTRLPRQRRDYFAVVCFRAAVLCGVLPIVVEVGTLLVYWLTLWKFLAEAGVRVLGGGLILTGVGLALWIAALVFAGGKRGSVKRPVRKRWLAGALVLLLGNVLVVAVCAVLGITVAFTTYIDIVNDTGKQIEACDVDAGGPWKFSAGPIMPGAYYRLRLSVFRGGNINLKIRQRGVPYEAVGFPAGHWSRVRVRPNFTCDSEPVVQ